ncbi:MAG: hypothetical protein H7144_17945 [Burkholderiales bacterium]|nr:hypothetical protein [Phycisphaerae bacterium]
MILTLGTTPAVARAMIFDRLTPDAVNRAAEVHVSAAGKAVNVARVARMMGHEVVCIGLVGGETGQTVRQNLESLGIQHSFIECAAPTRVCVTVIDRSTGQTTELVEEAGPAGVGDEERILELIADLAPRSEVLVCAGTIAPNISVDFYRSAAERAKRVNPSIRVIVDAKGPALSRALLAGVIVKCNRAEIGRDDLAIAMNQALQQGAAAIIVTDGPNPTHVTDGRSTWIIASPKVNVVSPIGSGDSLAAGVAAGLERGWPIQEAARLGVACAAVNAQSAIAGDVDRGAVERMFQVIQLIQKD